MLDSTCGAGDLLAPFAADPFARLLGIEVSADRARAAQALLPQARIINAAIEHCHITPASIGAVIINPPYGHANGRRIELHIMRQMIDCLLPNGVLGMIIPARSAWDSHMIALWSKHFHTIRVWMFPHTADPDAPESFARFTQAVIANCLIIL